MDEFLERNEHVKEIKAAVARETIHNLLLTIIARRNFLKNRRSTKNARLRPEGMPNVATLFLKKSTEKL